MISKTNAYQTSDGSTHADLASAQRHELEEILGVNVEGVEKGNMMTSLMENAEKVVDILTTKATSRTKARKVNKKSTKVTTATTPAV